jgi:hypothetical protein
LGLLFFLLIFILKHSPAAMTVVTHNNGTNGVHESKLAELFKSELQLTCTFKAEAAANGRKSDRFFSDYGIWKEAPVFVGSTEFEPLPDVKNIMITGGAGFM